MNTNIIIVAFFVLLALAAPIVVVLHNNKTHNYSFKNSCDTYTLLPGERVVRIDVGNVVTIEDKTSPHTYHNRSLNRGWCDTIVEQ